VIFTFWEGTMPEYIRLCMKTWRFPFTLLNYGNLGDYTDLPADQHLKRFPLAQVADCVRVHVLRDQGGYWLDADTIMLDDKLPDADIAGYPDARTNTIGFLRTEKGSEMFCRWAEHQDGILRSSDTPVLWSAMGNDFTDQYVREHKEIRIYPVGDSWAETYMIPGKAARQYKYSRLYFDEKYHLSDLRPTCMLMLHNSWTPQWYKGLTEEQILASDCTMSNVIKEASK